MSRFIAVLLVLVSHTSALAVVKRPHLLQPTTAAPVNRSPFEIDLAIDLPITLVSGVLTAVIATVGSEQRYVIQQTYDRGTLNAFDRTVLRFDNRNLAKASDWLLYSTFAVPVVFSLVDVLVDKRSDRWPGWGKDLLVLLEAMAISGMLNQAIKYAIKRPRPTLYRNPPAVGSTIKGTSRDAFYSGHTSAAFTAMTAYAYLFHLRHPKSPWRFVVWSGSMALATTVGLFRGFGGRHFWTDIITGAAVGATVGFLVPYLHLRKKRGTSTTELMIQPLISPSYRGLSLGMNW